MMTNEKFLPHPKLVYSAIMPLVALLFWSFSGSSGNKVSIVPAKVFVIDAAHGGDDPGAVSSSGLAEKEIALNLARLVYEIGKEQGLNIVLTRERDQSLSFKDRIALSTEKKADVFLSLHLGYDDNRVHKGFGMFVSDESVKLMESRRIAAILAGELSDIRGLDSPEMGIFNAFVLRENPAASMILEVGCLSDEQDVRFISDPMNQRNVAEKIVASLVKY